MNAEVIPLTYHPNIKNWYQTLSHLEGFALLEGTERFDILTALPYDRILIKRDEKISLDVIRSISEKINPKPSSFDFPFQGGALGYISYDFGALLHGIESAPQPDLTDMPLLNLGLYDWAIIIDHYNKSAHFFAAHQHATTLGVKKEILALWSNSKQQHHRAKFYVNPQLISLVSRNQYEYAFNSLMDGLKRGRCYQVNYTQPFHLNFEGDSWEVYQRIRSRNPVPYSAFLRTPEADILSFSPERFMEYEQGHLLTSPIKGTIRRSDQPEVDRALKYELLASEKNRAENIMIVDLMRNDLGKIAVSGSVKVEALCEIQSFKSVHHLVSDISATLLPHTSPFSALMSCFPGGSITGTPKLEAMKMIKEQELYARGVYCGSIGYFSNHGRIDTNIAIRTIISRNNILHLAAGGAIVIDSDCEDEYLECFTKISAIINAIK